jgi:hypothetical protein
MPNPEMLKRHVFTFNPRDNGGEALILTTEFYHALGGKEIFSNHEISLQSYGNEANFMLHSIDITPELLRALADQLEQAEMDAAAALEDKLYPSEDSA